MKKQSLLIFTPGFPADEDDTTCIPFLQQFCIALSEADPDMEVQVFTFQYPFHKQDYRWHGMNVFSFGGSNRKGIRRIAVWMNVIYRYLQLRRKYTIRGIYSIWLTECSMVGEVISSFTSVRHYTWIVGQDAKINNRYVRMIGPRQQNLIAMSAFISRQMEKNFNLVPSHIISNGIAPALFPALKTEQRTISVIGVSSLIPLKNLVLFIEIIEIASRYVHMDRVLIVGEGPEMMKLKLLIRAKGLDDLIGMTGAMPHAEVLKLMNDSRVFLHTSDYEGNASVLHEALYAGCQVVSTCPVDTERPDHFFMSQDKEEMIQKVIDLLSDKNEGYSSVALNLMDDSAKRVLQLFTDR